MENAIKKPTSNFQLPASKAKPLVVIVGPTASGKTNLAIDIAKKFNGEIICADSRTVYKYMDIGTAKPTKSEQSGIRHYGLDIITPDKTYSAANFKKMAQNAINDIYSRGKLPIIAGGTGLYVDSLLFDYKFLPIPITSERDRLNKLSVEQLQNEIIRKGIPIPANKQNPRHLIRAIETNGVVPKMGKLRSNTCVIGIKSDLTTLKSRIIKRVDKMLQNGFIKEVNDLSKKYGWDAPGLQAPGYKAFRKFIEGENDLNEAKYLFARADYLLAKRQITWFKRNKSIRWIASQSEAVEVVTTFMNK